MPVSSAPGRLSPRNLLPSAVVTAPAFSSAFPASNLADQPWIGRPARWTPASADAVLEITAELPSTVWVSVVALLFHTGSPSAEWRVRLVPPGGSLAAPSLDTGWTGMRKRAFASLATSWESSGFWLGQMEAQDRDLYPRHAIWTAPWVAGVAEDGLGGAQGQAVRARTVVVQVRDPLRAAWGSPAFMDVGGMWVGDTMRPAPRANHDHGRTWSFEDRSLRDEAPGGRIFTSVRPGRRVQGLSWSALDTAEAHGLMDAGVRGVAGEPMLWIPSPDSDASTIREAILCEWKERPTVTWSFEGAHTVRASLRELIS